MVTRRGAISASAAISLLALGGCREAPASLSSQDETWDTLWTYTVTLNDTALITPSWVEPFGDGLVVGDGNDARLTAFDADGSVRWIYAPLTGDGPGEMRFALDAAETSEGLWVLATPPRLLLLSEDGILQRQITFRPPPQGIVSQFEVLDDETGLIGVGRSTARVSLRDGQLSHEVEMPWRQAPPADWVGQFSLHVAGHHAALGMTYGPELLLLEGDSVQTTIVREDVPYRVRGQRVDMGGGMYRLEEPSGIMPFGTWRVRIVGSEVLVLTGGAWLNDRVGLEEPRLNNQLLIYDMDGTLKGRRELPFDTRDIAVTERRLYLLNQRDSAPALLALGRR